jgi:hypothetical protein
MLSDFYDKDGNKVDHKDDGSNAVFKQTSSGTDLHYELKGFDESQGGVDKVTDKAVTSAIEEQQTLNNDNPALKANAEGTGETHCNQATQDVLQTVGSALGDKSVDVKGSANDMNKQLNNGENPHFEKVDQKTAEKNAANGGLSMAGTVEKKNGHILTYSVGDNIKKGKVANIGPKKYSGFTSLNGAISKAKPKSYWILKP